MRDEKGGGLVRREWKEKDENSGVGGERGGQR